MVLRSRLCLMGVLARVLGLERFMLRLR
ncbi:hypothetical protein ACHAWO_003705 [Cyclotella atomus]|uniref:Uncharacterized protein n=1 Tax=Cyclotella atomus TaxID=382360 RepID=A0ABD3QD84_9STRA